MENVRLLSFELTEIPLDIIDITPSEAGSIQAPTFILTGDRSLEMYLLASQELAGHPTNG